MKYIDDSLNEIVSYNCMHEYARQLFYSPEEIGILFSDEFLIFKRLRPIDQLIEIIQNMNINNNMTENFSDINTINDPKYSSTIISRTNKLNNPL